MIHLSQLEHDALKGHQVGANRQAASALMKQDRAIEFDFAMLRDKQTNGYDQRADSQALRLQIEKSMFGEVA